MSENRILPVLGPAAILYLMADAFVRSGLAGVDVWVALVAVVASLAPLFVRGVEQDDAEGRTRFTWLAESAAVALAASLGPPEQHAVLSACVTAFVGGLLVDLALTVPDSPRRLRRLRPLAYVAALAVAALGGTARADVFEIFGVLVLVSSRFEALPELALVAFCALALAIRLVRRAIGSSPSALAANAWAIAGLFFAVPLLAAPALMEALPGLGSDPRLAGTTRSVATAILLASHAAMIDPRRRPVAGESIRAIVSVAIPIALAATVGGLVAGAMGERPLTLAAAAALLVFGARIFESGVRRPVRRVLAPRGGRLLDATRRATAGIERVSHLEGIAETTLSALRGPSTVSPWLMIDDPDLVFRVDAAGLLRRERRALPEALFGALHGHEGVPGPIILRDYEARVVREPAVRGLVEELNGLDAHTAVPLHGDGELQGVLLLTPRENSRPPTLEELAALERLGDVLGARLVSIKSSLRAQRRLHASLEDREALEERTEAMREELARLSRERAFNEGEAKEPALVAYSRGMRRVLERVEALAGSAQHVSFVAEAGSQCERLALELHQKGAGGADAPFVSVDCTLLAPDEALDALLGSAGAEGRTGWLACAHGGTLFLADVPALPREAQRELAEALSQKRFRPIGGAVSQELDARVVASAPAPLPELAERGGFDEELARWLSMATVPVPPLRERLDDLPSATWLAIGRASRAIGRESVGISEEAMEILRAYPWPGNERELHRVVRLAVSAAGGETILPSHLPPLGAPGPKVDPLEGTHAEVERRLIERALSRARGNKSEAARLLDMKRSTFMSKLRRLGIDE